MANVLHFWRNVYFILSLKQLRNIRKFKMIPAKWRAAINSEYIKLMVENKTLVVTDVEGVLLAKFSARLVTYKMFHQKHIT